MTSFAEVTPLAREWAWDGRIPAADVTLIAGMGGIGKSFLLADLTARITTSGTMPDGSYSTPGSVILAAAEDDASTATVHRLIAHGADLSRVHDAGSDLELPGSVPMLRKMIAEIGDVRLVVIDPLSAVTSVSLGSVVTVRRNILRPLQSLARETGVAIALVHHLTKAGSIGGSQGLVDGVRSVLRVERDPANPDIRTLLVYKTNVAAGDVEALRYTVSGDWPATTVRWLWTESEAYGPSQSRILLAIHAASGPLTPQQIASLTGISYGSVRVLVHQLVKRGLLSQPARGLYSPPAGSAS